MELYLSIIGAVTGIAGFIFSMLEHRRTRFLAVHDYLSAVESVEFIEAKKHVYNNDEFDITDNQAAMVVNYLHHWGMLAKRKYLPLWVFDGATGTGACRLYEKLLPYIENRKKIHDDPFYGEYFTWLYNKILKKYRKQ